MTVPELSQQMGLSQNSWQRDSSKSFEISTELIREWPLPYRTTCAKSRCAASTDAADAEDAMTAFRLATIASPDLISSDARALVKKAEDKLKEAFAAGRISRISPASPVETLSAIGLYN